MNEQVRIFCTFSHLYVLSPCTCSDDVLLLTYQRCTSVEPDISGSCFLACIFKHVNHVASGPSVNGCGEVQIC